MSNARDSHHTHVRAHTGSGVKTLWSHRSLKCDGSRLFVPFLLPSLALDVSRLFRCEMNLLLCLFVREIKIIHKKRHRAHFETKTTNMKNPQAASVSRVDV